MNERLLFATNHGEIFTWFFFVAWLEDPHRLDEMDPIENVEVDDIVLATSEMAPQAILFNNR